MHTINILDELTIDKIAAGEVVEKPLNVVKELVENAIDANATSITVEIKEGGISLIRVTDNGMGIPKSEIPKAFLRHATSKIVDAKDLLSIHSLGFRGEALSSIAAVSSVELITKEKDKLLGTRYQIEGSKELLIEDIGAPDGTTVIVRDLFFNVPARRKFLKTSSTEGSYIGSMMEYLALSHPEVSIELINNNKSVFSTSGNNNIKEVIYRIYGKEVMDRLIEFDLVRDGFKCTGYLGKPEINRSNRNFETIFVNNRYVHCDVISKAVEEGYKNFLMQHKFPFTVLYLEMSPELIDVNVHPAKLEIRLNNEQLIYDELAKEVRRALSEYELIPRSYIDADNDSKNKSAEDLISKVKNPEPFEIQRKVINNETLHEDIPESEPLIRHRSPSEETKPNLNLNLDLVPRRTASFESEETSLDEPKIEQVIKPSQLNLFEDEFLTKEAKEHYDILGQIFKTYWLIGYSDKLYIMDQHAAHEKVNYERFYKRYKAKEEVITQPLNPPIIVDVTAKEEGIVKEYFDVFKTLGIELEDFGLGSVAIRTMPVDLYGCNEYEFFKEVLDELSENPLKGNFDVILSKLASMSCKAAVKGNTDMSEDEVSALLDELLTLDNPFNCPHGRPTIISMSKTEFDKKFKRIV